MMVIRRSLSQRITCLVVAFFFISSLLFLWSYINGPSCEPDALPRKGKNPAKTENWQQQKGAQPQQPFYRDQGFPLRDPLPPASARDSVINSMDQWDSRRKEVLDFDSGFEFEDDEETEQMTAGLHIPGTDIAVGKNFPILFIGGVPRSGTTLMRVVADAHSNLHCGEETRVVPRLLQMRKQQSTPQETQRMDNAGIPQETLSQATRDYIFEILLAQFAGKASDSISMLCDKDPFNLNYVPMLKDMFPKAKFILMVRDGRAVAHSIITRHVTISGWNLESWEDVLSKWSGAMMKMMDECQKAGPMFCMPVFYEQLALQPNKTVREIVQFLELPWEEQLLHHQDQVGKNISVSLLERSTDQVAKPINLLGLNAWVGQIPKNAERKMHTLAPMLKKLGYDPFDTNPSYGEPDDIVKKNLQMLDENPDQFYIETFRTDKEGKISKGQLGQDEMNAKREKLLKEAAKSLN